MVSTCDSSTKGKPIAVPGPAISMANTQKGKENNTKGKREKQFVLTAAFLVTSVPETGRECCRESSLHWQRGEARLSQPLL